MKKTIDQLERKYQELAKAKADTEKYIQEQEGILQKMKADEAAAAEDGDFEKYREIKSRRQEVEDMIFVKKKTIEKYADMPFEMKDVTDAWDTYAKGYNKELSVRVEELRKAREALRKTLDDIVEFQNNALEVRERCSEYCGGKIKPSAFLMDYVPVDNAEGLKYKQWRCSPSDLIYMAARGFWTHDELGRAIAILNGHTPTPKGAHGDW